MKTGISLWLCLRIAVLLALGFAAAKSFSADAPLPATTPVVHIVAADPWAAEAGSDPARFAVVREGPTNATLTVQYQVGGTALNGVDYLELSGAVTIPAGQRRAAITVTPIDDRLVEGTESVVIALQQPPVWPPPYLVCWPSVAVAHIIDDDSAPTNRPPVVRLVNPPNGSVFQAPVDLVLVAHAWDFDGRVRTVEFFDGNRSLGIVTNRPVLRAEPATLTAEEDDLLPDPAAYPDLDVAVRPPEPVPLPLDVFRLLWSNVPAGPHVLTAVATDTGGARATSAPVEIKVLEAPPQNVVNVLATDPEAAEPDPLLPAINTGTFTVVRRGSTDFPLVVFYRLSGTALNGVDYRELPATVTIPEGESSVDIIVEPLDDNLVEGPESVVLTILPPICPEIHPPPPECYLVGPHPVDRVVIRDNDPPPTNRPPSVAIVRPLDGSVFLAPADIAIVADASDPDGWVHTVEFFEGTNSLGIVTNAPWSVDPPRPRFWLVWSNVPPGHYFLWALATDNLGAAARSRPVEIKVARPTVPPVVNIVTTDPEAAEPDPLLPAFNTASFLISRSGPTNLPLDVFYSVGGTAANGLDYQFLPGMLRIPAGASGASLVVWPIDDTLVEGTETILIRLEPPVCLAVYPPPPDCYVVGPSNRAWAIIRDNDLPATNLPPRVEIVRPAGGEVFVAPTDIAMLAAAFDPDGFVRYVEFFAGTNKLGAVSNSLVAVSNTLPTAEQLFRFLWEDVRPGSYVLTARAVDNRGAASVSPPVPIRVLPARPPVVTIVATDPYASEGEWDVDPAGTGPLPRPNTALFTVRRSGGTNTALTVSYRLSGTASNGVDYRPLPGTVTIPVGAWSAGILVVPIDDNLVEGTETVIAALEPRACATVYPPPADCYVVGDPGRALAYLRDNDVPPNQPPKVEIVKPEEGEVFPAGSDVEIRVLAQDPDGWVGRLDFYEGANLIGTQEVLFIVPPPPGQPQRFYLTWSNAPPGGYRLTVVATDNLGTTSRSDPVTLRVVAMPPLPVVTIDAIDPVATEQSPDLDALPDTAVFEVRRTGDLTEDLKVFYTVSGTASNGVDYQRLSGEVVIPANAATATVLIDPIDDDLVEGPESVVLTLVQLRCVTTNVPPPPGCYVVGQPGSARAWLNDNDGGGNIPPHIVLVSPPDGASFDAPANIGVVAQTVDPDGWVGLIEFFAGTNKIGEVSIMFIVPPPPGQWQTFALRWTDVPAGRYALTAVATDNLGATARSAPVLVTVQEPPAVPVVTLFAPDPLAREGTTNTATFAVRRSGPTNLPLTVWYEVRGTASNGVDYVAIPDRVTIPAGRRTARVVIEPIDDRLVERIETVILRLVEPPTMQPGLSYLIGRPGAAAAVIVDNDFRPPPCRRLPDGLFHACLAGPTGFGFRLEASADLRTWEPLFSNWATEDEVQFVDPEAETAPLRFYRVLPDLPPSLND